MRGSRLAGDVADADDGWLVRFHDGERAVIEACYREHFQTVFRAIGQIVRGADQETVTHELFYRMISDPSFRRSFHGGSLAGWLTTVAKHQALDHRRRRAREQPIDGDEPAPADVFGDAAEARLEIERFRAQVLPAKWARVFEARFLEQLDQREAARRLGMSRTTLAYQELRIRSLLRKYLLRGGGP